MREIISQAKQAVRSHQRRRPHDLPALPGTPASAPAPASASVPPLVSAFCVPAADTDPLRQMQESLRRQNQRLGLLSEAAADLLRPGQPASMVRDLFDRVSGPLGLDAYFNFMVDEGGEELRLDSCAGIPLDAAARITRLAFGQAVCGTVARTRKAMYVDHVQQSDDPKVELIRSFGIRAYACNPLIVGDRLLGTLSFATRGRDGFSEEDLEFLRTICHYVALAKERTWAEQAREQALKREQAARAEAESANAAKDQFLAVLSHELRTPLTPVLIAASTLEQDQDLPEHLREDLAVVRRNVELEARLIDDLLDLTRITRGKLELRREVTDVQTVLRHAIDICRTAHSPQRRLSIAGELLAPRSRVWGDAPRLQQVFWNLISNATKFSPDAAQVKVRCEQTHGDRLRIQVIDQGIGIDPQMLPRLFDAFEQGGAGTTRRFGGLGLGLAISKAIVELHGGTLTGFSAGPNRGSTFTVELPLIGSLAASDLSRPPRTIATPLLSPIQNPKSKIQNDSAPWPQASAPPVAFPAPQTAAPPPPLLAPPTSRPTRVLLVEDHPDTLRLMCRLLEKLGYDVIAADSVASALQLASSESFDLLISDMGLGDGSGLDLMRQLSLQHGFTRRAIALTGYGMEDDIQRSHQAGFLQHLTKPVDFRRLQSAIQTALQTELPPPPAAFA